MLFENYKKRNVLTNASIAKIVFVFVIVYREDPSTVVMTTCLMDKK